MKQYVEDALKTKSHQFHSKEVGTHRFGSGFGEFIEAAKELDKIKKKLFYGKGGRLFQHAEDFPLHEAARGFGPNEVDIAHAIVGIGTEAGELAEMLWEFIYGSREMDMLHLKEEIGDVMWYIAILLNSIGSSFEEVAAMNISKLAARYPEKFTSANAESRNLEAEAAALKKGEL